MVALSGQREGVWQVFLLKWEKKTNNKKQQTNNNTTENSLSVESVAFISASLGLKNGCCLACFQAKSDITFK